MTLCSKLKVGTGLLAAGALAAGLLALQAGSQTPTDLAQLSNDEKLEILNSGDEDAIMELLEAEEAAGQARFARERLEREMLQAEKDALRAAAKERGAAYWGSFDPDSIDLTGFDFSMVEITQPDEQRAMLDEMAIVTGFARAAEMTYPPNNGPCSDVRYKDIRNMLEIKPAPPMPVGEFDVARIADYLSHRAALETGDCSCATQLAPPETAWLLLERLTSHPSGADLRGSRAQGEAVGIIGVMFNRALQSEMRSFCGLD